LNLCRELGNDELYSQVKGEPEDLTISNVVDRLIIQMSLDEDIERELEFCSSHFSAIDWGSIFSLPIEIVSSIVSRDSLRLRDEDSFSDKNRDRICEDSRF
jgi:hypothetical protein